MSVELLGKPKVVRGTGGGEPEPVTVTIDQQPPIVIPVGGTFQFTATTSDGSTVYWTNTAPDVVSVNTTTGLATYVGPGVATIRAIHPTLGFAAYDSITVSCASPASLDGLVDFSGAPAGHEYILGPLTIAGDGKMDGTSATTDREPWPFVTYSLEQMPVGGGSVPATGTASYNLDRYPRFYPKILEGTVSIDPAVNPRKVYGTGTFFTKRIDPYPNQTPQMQGWDFDKVLLRDAGNIWRTVRVESVESDTELTLEDDWAFGAASGVKISTDTGAGSNNLFDTESHTYAWRYYDIGKIAYAIAYRNVGYYDPNHPDFIRAARIADCWYQCPKSANDGNFIIPGLAPRSQAIEMLYLRAAELTHLGDPRAQAYWNFCLGYCDYHYWSWGWRHLDNFDIYYIRDTGYANMFASQLAVVLPDGEYTPAKGGSGQMPLVGGKISGSAARAWLKSRVVIMNGQEDGSGNLIDHMCRTQNEFGAWLDFYYDHGWGEQFTQPFQMGLLLDGMRFAYQLLESSHPTNAANVLAAIELGAEFLAKSYRRYEPVYDATTGATSVMWRDTGYNVPKDGEWRYRVQGTANLTHGGTSVTGDGTLFSEQFMPGMKLGFLKRLSGTVSRASGSAIWTGTGTSFLTDLAPGDILSVQKGYTYAHVVVASVESDTQFTSAFTNSNNFTFSGAAVDLVLGHHLPGYVSATKDSTALVGVGTSFLTDFSPGDQIFFNWGVTYWGWINIASIESDTELTLGKPWPSGSQPVCAYSDLNGGGYVIDSITDDETLTLRHPFNHPRGVNEGAALVARCWYRAGDNGVVQQGTYGVEAGRLLLPESCNIYGWLLEETLDPKWLDWGDSIYSACFGKGVGPGADPHCSRIYPTGSDVSSKPWNQSYRQSFPYLGHRLRYLASL